MLNINWKFLLIFGVTVFPALTIRLAHIVLQDNPSKVSIQSPWPGQAIQGTTPIIVNTVIDGFKSAELYFAYTNNPTGSWFFLTQSGEPANGIMLDWDTTLITDGNYDLKLVVKLQDNTQVEAVIQGVRVRNYSPVETDTPAPVLPTSTLQPGEIPAATATLTPTITQIPTITPTPTPLPTNPAELPSGKILSSFGLSSVVVLGLFASLGIYTWIRNSRRNKKVG